MTRSGKAKGKRNKTAAQTSDWLPMLRKLHPMESALKTQNPPFCPDLGQRVLTGSTEADGRPRQKTGSPSQGTTRAPPAPVPLSL